MIAIFALLLVNLSPQNSYSILITEKKHPTKQKISLLIELNRQIW